VIDRNYNIVDANDSSSTHFNLSIVRILGQLCYKVTHKSDTPCWELPDISCPVKTAFETQVRAQAIHKHFVKNELIVEEIVATPLDDDGNYVLEEFRDITELLGLIEGMILPRKGGHTVKLPEPNARNPQEKGSSAANGGVSDCRMFRCIQRYWF